MIFNSQNISSINILDSSYNNVSFGSVLGPDTKYTNEVTINSKGVFRLQIQKLFTTYRSSIVSAVPIYRL